MATWAMEEFAEAKLGDGRQWQLLIKLAARFADKPTFSSQCATWPSEQ